MMLELRQRPDNHGSGEDFIGYCAESGNSFIPNHSAVRME